MMSPTTTRLVKALFLLTPLCATADPQDCTSIPADHERLACYDREFGVDPDALVEALPPIAARRAQESRQLHEWFAIIPHRPNYFIPAAYNANADFSLYGDFGNLLSDTEAQFQISLKTQIMPRLWRNSSLWAAYTQKSYWQLYADDEASAPFRETNHEPEVIWQVPVDFRLFGMDARLASFSFNHQSNGRAAPLSRSWNRLTGMLVLERGRFVGVVQSWVRVDDPSNDDNPNIEDFMGRILIGGAYKGDRHTITLSLKNNLRSDNRSGVELNWTFPLAQHLKGFVQLYSGYGENLIDMENYNNRIGLGIALTDWL